MSLNPNDPSNQLLLHYIAQGIGNKEIAQLLGLSVSGVKYRMTNLFNFMGVGSKYELLVKLYQGERSKSASHRAEETPDKILLHQDSMYGGDDLFSGPRIGGD